MGAAKAAILLVKTPQINVVLTHLWYSLVNTRSTGEYQFSQVGILWYSPVNTTDKPFNINSSINYTTQPLMSLRIFWYSPT